MKKHFQEIKLSFEQNYQDLDDKFTAVVHYRQADKQTDRWTVQTDKRTDGRTFGGLRTSPTEKETLEKSGRYLETGRL